MLPVPVSYIQISVRTRDNGMSSGIDIDPLDAYMDSIAGEITQQAVEVPSPSPPSPPPTSSFPQLASPSPAQRAIADKVSASPFCDILTSVQRGAGDTSWEHRTGSVAASQPSRAGGSGGGGGGSGEANRPGGSGGAGEACLCLLLGHPAEFLR